MIRRVTQDEMIAATGKYAFGWYFPKDGILILKDLPRRVQYFLLFHEFYHAEDASEGWFQRELKANWHGFKKCPIGALHCFWLSITSWERIKYYLNRFKEKR